MDPEVIETPRKKKRIKRDSSSASPAPGGRLPPLRNLPRMSNEPPLPQATFTVTPDDSQPVKKPRRKTTNDAGSREDLVPDDDTTPRAETQPRRKRKKKTARTAADQSGDNLGLATELYDLKDDIIDDRTDLRTPGDVEGGTAGSLGGGVNGGEVGGIGAPVPTMKSEPTGKLFIEQRNGFKVVNKTKVEQRRADDDQRRAELATQSAEARLQSTTDLALSMHYGLERIYGFMRGMLAGISLWQIISTYMLINQGATVFLSSYYMLATPIQCLYFFLFAICTVSVFDRFDVSRPTRLCLVQSISFQIGAIAILFYFIGLVFSVSTAFLDEKIGMYAVDPSLWNSTVNPSANSDISTWSILNLIRGIMAMLGFLVICFSRPIDRLKESLKLSDENILSLDNRPFNAVPMTTTQGNPPVPSLGGQGAGGDMNTGGMRGGGGYRTGTSLA